MQRLRFRGLRVEGFVSQGLGAGFTSVSQGRRVKQEGISAAESKLGGKFQVILLRRWEASFRVGVVGKRIWF